MRAIVLGLALVSSPAMATEQFDLLCEGQSKLRINAKWQPVSLSYRIDLESGSWCGGACETVNRIHRIEAGKVVLAQSDPADRVGPSVINEIDRVTGKFRQRTVSQYSWYEAEGQCTASAFSGFPSKKF